MHQLQTFSVNNLESDPQKNHYMYKVDKLLIKGVTAKWTEGSMQLHQKKLVHMQEGRKDSHTETDNFGPARSRRPESALNIIQWVALKTGGSFFLHICIILPPETQLFVKSCSNWYRRGLWQSETATKQPLPDIALHVICPDNLHFILARSFRGWALSMLLCMYSSLSLQLILDPYPCPLP